MVVMNISNSTRLNDRASKIALGHARYRRREARNS